MSSYNQVEEKRTLAETLSMAATEIMALEEEMADLCATIAGQFPDTYERIAKYQEAHSAWQALASARALLEDPLASITPSYRDKRVVVTVGRQTRFRRSTSQRVRLGNAVVRMRGVTAVLQPDGTDEETAAELAANITALEDVTFPTRHG